MEYRATKTWVDLHQLWTAAIARFRFHWEILTSGYRQQQAQPSQRAYHNRNGIATKAKKQSKHEKAVLQFINLQI